MGGLVLLTVRKSTPKHGTDQPNARHVQHHLHWSQFQGHVHDGAGAMDRRFKIQRQHMLDFLTMHVQTGLYQTFFSISF